MAFAISRFLGPQRLDVVVRERHESDLLITRNPVEFGADVSDHAIIEPKRLTLDAVAGSRPGTPATIQAAWQTIKRLQESRQPFTIVTALDVYRNMLVERLTVDRDKTYGRVLFFRAELREVIIVDTESDPGSSGGTTQSGLRSGSLQEGAARDRGSPTTQRGNTATRPAPTAGGGARAGQVASGNAATGSAGYEPARNSSILSNIFGSE